MIETLDVSYDTQIRPIFQARCHGCHQPAKAKGDYVMTTFKQLIAGGYAYEAERSWRFRNGERVGVPRAVAVVELRDRVAVVQILPGDLGQGAALANGAILQARRGPGVDG